MLITRVELSRQVSKQLSKPGRVPVMIVKRFQLWVAEVGISGLGEVQQRSKWRDHALKGERKNQRAVSLGPKWRVIYEVLESGEAKIVFVEEVTPHDYRKKG